MTLTPAMAQFYELKELYSDSVLFFRMGDFYEMFDEDAMIAHRVLWIAVTTRNKNAETPTPLAGFPFHAKEKYLPLLVNAWYKVAIAEQVGDPKLKWIVKREVVRVVTPATLGLEWESYEASSENQILISIIEEKGNFGVSLLNLANNKWEVSECSWIETLAWYVSKIAPQEVILEKKLFWDESIKEIFQKKISLNISYFEQKKKFKKTLLDHFGVVNLVGFGIEELELSQKAAALLLEYVETNQNTEINFLHSLSVAHFSEYLQLDEATLNSLDLLYNMSTKSATSWTLYGVLNNTKSSLWAHYLRDQITKPLQNKKEIISRQDFIEEFIKNRSILDNIRLELQSLSNVHSILNRLALWRATPKDLLVLKRSLESIENIFKIIKQSENTILKKLLI